MRVADQRIASGSRNGLFLLLIIAFAVVAIGCADRTRDREPMSDEEREAEADERLSSLLDPTELPNPVTDPAVVLMDGGPSGRFAADGVPVSFSYPAHMHARVVSTRRMGSGSNARRETVIQLSYGMSEIRVVWQTGTSGVASMESAFQTMLSNTYPTAFLAQGEVKLAQVGDTRIPGNAASGSDVVGDATAAPEATEGFAGMQAAGWDLFKRGSRIVTETEHWTPVTRSAGALSFDGEYASMFETNRNYTVVREQAQAGGDTFYLFYVTELRDAPVMQSAQAVFHSTLRLDGTQAEPNPQPTTGTTDGMSDDRG